jgi:hypothetical protein
MVQRIHFPPHLDQLTLCESWDRFFSVDGLFNSSVKNLHITTRQPNGIINQVIGRPHFMETLTHLSWVFDNAIDSHASISIFEVALRYGTNLKCLRVRCRLGPAPHSRYFQQYTEALPHLIEFGIYVTSEHSDPDFFPAVCDFLTPKVARLVHLELASPCRIGVLQDGLGYNGGRACWSLFKNPSHHRIPRSFRLESLSMPLPAGKANFGLHYSKLIPRSVTRLSLSGHDLAHNINQIFKVVSFWYICNLAITIDLRITVSIQETRSQLASKPPSCLHTSPLFRSSSSSRLCVEKYIGGTSREVYPHYPSGEDYESHWKR